MNHRLEKLTTLLDANETHQNVENITEVSIDCENETRKNNSSSSPIKVEPLLMPKSKRFKIKVYSSTDKTCN
jgi:hypothetical protein